MGGRKRRARRKRGAGKGRERRGGKRSIRFCWSPSKLSCIQGCRGADLLHGYGELPWLQIACSEPIRSRFLRAARPHRVQDLDGRALAFLFDEIWRVPLVVESARVSLNAETRAMPARSCGEGTRRAREREEVETDVDHDLDVGPLSRGPGGVLVEPILPENLSVDRVLGREDIDGEGKREVRLSRLWDLAA